MDDPLTKIFTPEVMEKLDSIVSKSEVLQFRLTVLRADDSKPDPFGLLVMKNAWRDYLEAAFNCELLTSAQGDELRARLAGTDDENFASAISECLAAWVLTRKFGFQINPRPPGRAGKVLEFAIVLADGEINVEVKAPHSAITGPILGDDSESFRQTIFSANRQFKPGNRNLLVIVADRSSTRLLPDALRRGTLLKALLGESVIQVPIDPRTGGPAGPTTTGFQASGEFLKTWRSNTNEEGTKSPRFTRISGVFLIIQDMPGDGINLYALLVHNPHAQSALPRDIWTGVPQFTDNNGVWTWKNP
jgi:hypothetical protein